MSSFEDILVVMNKAIAAFEKVVPNVQNKALDKIVNLTKDLETRNGKILNSVENLKLISQIKTELKKITLSAEYKSAVKDFVKTFDALSSLQENYFKKYVPKFKPEKKLSVIRDYAVDQTIYDLMGQGMDSQVVEPITSILRDNITSGGSYAKFQQELADYLTDNASGDGKLMRYTKQITTDAIHQYNSQYHETIAQDLKFEWGRYVGSDIETTRQFCDLMTDKDYFHISELPEILKGHIDGNQCKLSKTTGLPLGMIPGTNSDNFKVRRGGYNCRHGVYMIPESAVPANIKNRLKNSKSAKDLSSDANYENVKFDQESGGLQAFHKRHHFDPKTGHHEKEVADVLSKNGNKIILGDESSGAGKKVDGTLNDSTAEISTIIGTGKNTIKRALNHSRQKDAEIAIIYFPDKQDYSAQRISEGIAKYEGQTKHRFKKIVVIAGKEIIQQ